MPNTHSRLKKQCWIITEGIAGTENQCIGVAKHLGVPFDVKRIKLSQPWKTFSPYLKFERSWAFTPTLSAPWPDIVIASGRKSIAASRFIKKQSQGRTITVQIQDPRISAKNFDLIAVPEHDPLRGSNVIVTQASPNKITEDALNQARFDFPNLGASKNPRVAVLIGGNSKAYDMTADITKRLAHDLSRIDAHLMITCSRRTGADNQKILETILDDGTNYFWKGNGENPYLAFLAWADFILVTADSASMISESCTTGKPVYMIDLQGGSKRITRLHDNLIANNKLRRFNGTLEHYDYEPLKDAQMVANEIKKRFGALLQNNDD